MEDKNEVLINAENAIAKFDELIYTLLDSDKDLTVIENNLKNTIDNKQ